jgi:hypothetical protein
MNTKELETRLDDLLSSYREACPDIDPGPNFMPEIWARIEAREVSTNWFGRMAKVLVTAALATSAVLALLMSSTSDSASFYNGTFVQALMAEHISTLEPLHVDRISEIEMQRQ